MRWMSVGAPLSLARHWVGILVTFSPGGRFRYRMSLTTTVKSSRSPCRDTAKSHTHRPRISDTIARGMSTFPCWRFNLLLLLWNERPPLGPLGARVTQQGIPQLLRSDFLQIAVH